MPRSESMATSTMSSSTSLASVASRGSPGVVTPQTLAMKARKNLKKGGKSMRVACYADDPKEPELIGDCYVGIDEVLRKGEIDGESLHSSVSVKLTWRSPQNGMNSCTRTSMPERCTWS